MSYNKKKPQKSNLDYENNFRQDAGGQPLNKEGKPNTYINAKVLKALPSSSISMQADPYTSALPSSQPFPFVNVPNRYVGGNYSGDRNLDGGSAKQYATSLLSNFLKITDTIMMKLNLNYQYIDPTEQRDPEIGVRIIDDMRKVIAETVSLLEATTFTQMAIYHYAIETSMPMGSANFETLENGNKIYYDLTDVIYGACTHYQTVLQAILLAFNEHNSFRTKMGTMIRMEYQRNIPNLNNLFSLFKKKSYLSLANSIAMDISGEYIDIDWMRQANTQLLTPSRRSTSINEPLLELCGSYNLPKVFKLHVLDDEGNILDTVYDLESQVFQVGKLNYSLSQLLSKFATLMSAQDTLTWARNTAYSATSGNERFNTASSIWKAISSFMNYFKIAFNDIRTVLDTLARTDVISWKRGFKPLIIKDTDMPYMPRNLIVDNIMQVALTGPTTVTFDDITKYWKSWTLWNMYTGIPEYDAYSGGSFLSFSLKDVDATADNKGYIPLGFTLPYDYETGDPVPCFWATTRDGVQFNFGAEELNLKSDLATRRLIALPSQNAYKAYIPSVTKSHAVTKAATDDHMSFLVRTLSVLGGYCKVENKTFSESDLLVVYDIQIPDISSEMISYARSHGPFRGSRVANQFGYLGTLPMK